MNCDRAQAVLSDRLDGERAPDRVGATVDEHVATCTRCRAFEANALRLRTSLRVRLAEPVPDLVGSIMARVASESVDERPLMLPATGRSRASARRRLTPVDRGRARRTHGGQRRGRRTVAASEHTADRCGGGRHGHPASRPVPRRVRGHVRDHGARPVARRARATAADGRGVPGAAAVPAGRARRDDLPVGALDADRPDVHRRRLIHVSVRRDRMSGRSPGGWLPAHADHDHEAVRVLGAGAGPRRPGAAADDVLVGRRHPGGGDGSRRGTRRDPGAADVRTRTRAVPVPRAGWHVAAVLRRRPRGPLAGCVGLVPAALHRLSVDRSVAPAVGAPVRSATRAEHPADLRRAPHLGGARRARRGDVRCPRLDAGGHRPARGVPPACRLPARHADRTRGSACCRRPSSRPEPTPTRRAPSSSTRTAWRTCASANDPTGRAPRCSAPSGRRRNRWIWRPAASPTTSRRATGSAAASRSTRRARTCSSSPTSHGLSSWRWRPHSRSGAKPGPTPGGRSPAPASRSSRSPPRTRSRGRRSPWSSPRRCRADTSWRARRSRPTPRTGTWSA